MVVIKPELYPSKGYVEDIDENGKHYLRKVNDPNENAISALQKENELLKAQLRAQTDRSEFIEDCIAEMAMQVYGGV